MRFRISRAYAQGYLAALASVTLTVSCNRSATLNLENTSGEPMIVQVRGGTDVFVDDTLGSGHSICWVAPDRYRNKVVQIELSTQRGGLWAPERTATIPGLWVDSVVLDRHSSVQIHASTNTPPTLTWLGAQSAARQRANNILIAERLRVIGGGIPLPSEKQLNDAVEDVSMSARADPGAPSISIHAEIVKSRECTVAR